VSVEGSRFKQSLVAAGDVQVDILKSDVNFSTVAPYYLGVNLTTMTVRVFFLIFVPFVLCGFWVKELVG